jgi:hypothetical protein
MRSIIAIPGGHGTGLFVANSCRNRALHSQAKSLAPTGRHKSGYTLALGFIKTGRAFTKRRNLPR